MKNYSSDIHLIQFVIFLQLTKTFLYLPVTYLLEGSIMHFYIKGILRPILCIDINTDIDRK